MNLHEYHPADPQAILQAVCDELNIAQEAIQGPSRHSRMIRARMVAIYLIDRHCLPMCDTELSAWIGKTRTAAPWYLSKALRLIDHPHWVDLCDRIMQRVPMQRRYSAEYIRLACAVLDGCSIEELREMLELRGEMLESRGKSLTTANTVV